MSHAPPHTQHTINSHKNISYPIVTTIMTSTSTRRLHGLAGGGVLLVTLLQGDHLDQSEVSTRSRDPAPPITAHLLADHAEHDSVQRPAPLLLLLDVLPPPGRGHHGLQRRAVLPAAGVLRCAQCSVCRGNVRRYGIRAANEPSANHRNHCEVIRVRRDGWVG